MKKLSEEKKYNIRFFSTSIFLTAAISMTTFNVYKNTKEMNEYYAKLESYKIEKDLHISNSLDTVDEIIEMCKAYEEVEEPVTEVELFSDSDDYYDLDKNEYVTDEELLNPEAFEVTVDNKTYGYLPEEDFELFTAVVAAESNGNKYDSLAVASSILNRCDSEKWVNHIDSKGKDGQNPINHITASGQYSVYREGNYIKYLNGNVSKDIKEACEAAWYNGIRNHNYCSFRATSETSYSDNQIDKGGNRFNDEIKTKKL